MVLAAGAARWRIEEVPVPYLRRTGRSKVTGTVRGTLGAVHDMRCQLRTFSRDPVVARPTDVLSTPIRPTEKDPSHD